MNHDLLKTVIFEQHEIIREATIVPRRYTLDPHANYLCTGIRRAGKSTLLYSIVRNLVESGVNWDRIIYINFEDERLADFTTADFQDILLVQHELSAEKGFFFFDEIQNIPNWEKFVRRLADAKERVHITGSNATMLSGAMMSTLGGRYYIKHVTPYRFDEYLTAHGQAYDDRALHVTRDVGRILGLFESYYHLGGFPESIGALSPREYVQGVYQKVLLGDIATRNKIRNVDALRALIKKIAETVRSDVSYSTLHNTLKSIGYSVGKETIISYIAQAKETYLLFSISNYAAKYVDRETTPKYYFSDNGLLNLFLYDRDTALLENVVAVALHDVYGEELYYLKSSKTGIDLDFYVPEAGLAVQVAYSIAGDARKREVGNLAKLADTQSDLKRLVIVTKEEEEVIQESNCTIEVIPAWKFLLQLASMPIMYDDALTPISWA